jgi:putative colanic acid biosynthesis acetyltransferase WcaF
MQEIQLHNYSQKEYHRGRSAFMVVLWDLVQTWLIHLSPHSFYGWRRFLYRLFGATIGKKVLIRKSVICNYPWNLSIGDYSWIGDQVNLYALEKIIIAKQVVISQQAYLCTGTHNHEAVRFSLIVKSICIETSAWVALGALVMPGVTVGEGALIGARAVLTKDAKPWTIYQGIPAQPVGERVIKDTSNHV